MKYSGSCHCKAVQFNFEADEITQALQCNCSICIRKNAIMSLAKIEESKMKIVGSEHLGNYQWGDKDVNHYFCKNCGIYPFHNTTFEPITYRINLGCIDGIHSRDLSIKYFDGKNEL